MNLQCCLLSLKSESEPNVLEVNSIVNICALMIPEEIFYTYIFHMLNHTSFYGKYIEKSCFVNSLIDSRTSILYKIPDHSGF